MTMMEDQERRAEAKRLWSQGKNIGEIKDALGCTEADLARWDRTLYGLYRQYEEFPPVTSDNEIIVEMQHRHRLLMHDIKGIYALLNNNRKLSDRRTPEQALAESEHVIDIACDRLKEIFE